MFNIDVEDKTDDLGHKPAPLSIYPPLIPQEYPWGKNPALRGKKNQWLSTWVAKLFFK